MNHHVPLPAIAKNLNEAEILTRFFSDEVEIFSHQTTVGKAFADDAMYQEIIQSISPILALLSEKRASAIRQYLKYRLHYLKAAMG